MVVVRNREIECRNAFAVQVEAEGGHRRASAEEGAARDRPHWETAQHGRARGERVLTTSPILLYTPVGTMADAAEPRRSQRERKQAAQFVSGKGSPREECNHMLTNVTVNSSLLKRKRSDATSDEENGAEDARDEVSDHEAADNEADAEEGDYHAPKPSGKSPTKRKTKAAAAPKKPRAPKGAGTKRANAKPAGPPKPRKTTARKGKQATTGDGEFDPEKVVKDSKIAGDNALFSALYNFFYATRSYFGG